MRNAGRGNLGRTARAIKSLIIPLRHFISLGRAARKVEKCGKQQLLLLLSCCLGRRKFSPRLLQLIFLSSVFGFSFSFKACHVCVHVCVCVLVHLLVARLTFAQLWQKKRTFAVIAQLNLETPSCHSRKQLSFIVWFFLGSFCSAANGNFLCSQ